MIDHTPNDLMQRCNVYPANMFRVEVGAMMGESLGLADLTCAGDVYELSRSASLHELVLRSDGPLRTLDADSPFGPANTLVNMLARHSLMSERGASIEVLLLQIADQEVIMPLGPLSKGEEYVLMSSAPIEVEHVLSDVASVSFTRGTHVTMGNGLQVPVEQLQVGDKLLTRDHGPQPIRWIGRQTVRAEGQRASVCITKGALNNAQDLVLSPDHRLFIYQRRDVIGAGRAEVMVRARHLVNDETIFLREDAHVEYFHLLFENHEIIYVEGIQAESLLVAPDVLAGMDDEMIGDLTRNAGDLTHSPQRGAEPTASDLVGKDTAALLKRASSG